MKPQVEFILSCLLIFVAGCSAIVGIFSPNMWTIIFTIGSIAGLVVILMNGTKSKQ